MRRRELIAHLGGRIEAELAMKVTLAEFSTEARRSRTGHGTRRRRRRALGEPPEEGVTNMMSTVDTLPQTYHDLRDHIEALDRAGLLYRIDKPVNKDTEMHPLVRWQYRGGLQDEQRKAFLFTNVTDSTGRRYENARARRRARRIEERSTRSASAPNLDEIGKTWTNALAHPIEPIVVESGSCQEVVHTGKELEEWGGLANLPIPISTPGYDNAPYFSSAHYISKDPDTGVRNCGNYRGQFKGPLTVGCFFVPFGNDRQVHWEKMRKRGEHLPIAIVLGAPPVVSYTSVQRMPIEADEFAVAGGLAGEAIRMVKCKTIDLDVPADCEVVIEGYLRTDYLEPEGPFGESHGFVHPRSMSANVEITAITHRRDFIATSFISQVTPSESSIIKRVAYEPMFLDFLQRTCGVKSVKARRDARSAHEHPSGDLLAVQRSRRRRRVARAQSRVVVQGRRGQDDRRGERGHRCRTISMP